MSFRDALDHVDEVRAAELQRRNVDRNGQIRPCPAVDTGATQHPVAEIDDQSAVLGNRDEFGRWDVAAGRMFPAAQCLHADNGISPLLLTTG